MWICEKCGREFKRTNQGHYCGRAPESVDEYSEQQIAESRAHITALRAIIQRCVPGVTAGISWSMPMYKKDGFSISFAACKKYISLYIDMNALETFRSQLNEFVIKKNAIYLSYDKALPVETIENLVKHSFDVK